MVDDVDMAAAIAGRNPHLPDPRLDDVRVHDSRADLARRPFVSLPPPNAADHLGPLGGLGPVFAGRVDLVELAGDVGPQIRPTVREVRYGCEHLLRRYVGVHAELNSRHSCPLLLATAKRAPLG